MHAYRFNHDIYTNPHQTTNHPFPSPNPTGNKGYSSNVGGYIPNLIDDSFPPLRQSSHILHQNLRFKKPLLRQLSVIRTPLEPIEDLEQMIEVDPKHFASLRKSSKRLSISWHHAFGEINGLRKKNIMHAHD